MEGNKLLSYQPAYYKKSRMMGNANDTNAVELTAFIEKVQETENQFFLNTADTSLRRWEQELGLPTDSTLAFELRRAKILTKLMGQDISTIEVIQKIAQSYSGGKVEVEEIFSQYYFNLFFWQEETSLFTFLKELTYALEEIKPCHLGFFYIMCMTAFFYHKNQLTFPKLTFHMGVSQFVEGYQFNGAHLLDGTWKLSGHRKGIGFPCLKIGLFGQTKIKGSFSYAVELGIKNKMQLSLKQMYFQAYFANLIRGYRFNGNKTLDGSWFLNSMGNEILLYRFGIYTKIKIPVKNQYSIQYFLKGKYQSKSILNQLFFSYLGSKFFQKGVQIEQVTFLAEIQNKVLAKSFLTMDSMWYLDGTAYLDGDNRRLNAAMITSEI